MTELGEKASGLHNLLATPPVFFSSASALKTIASRRCAERSRFASSACLAERSPGFSNVWSSMRVEGSSIPEIFLAREMSVDLRR